LGLAEDQKTTDDMLYTLEIVSCIGACALAPAVVVDGKVHGQMSPEKLSQLLDALENEEKTEGNK
ncbi:MAG: NAD(P)H-dependent oxidoreductase subunit E, partial [Armatimonadota bacterium]